MAIAGSLRRLAGLGQARGSGTMGVTARCARASLVYTSFEVLVLLCLLFGDLVSTIGGGGEA